MLSIFLTPSSEVITDAFVKAGLVLEKDAKQSLKVRAFLYGEIVLVTLH